MKNHPPDRILDPPEPTDDELRRDKLQAEYEEDRRREFTRLMGKVKRTISDAYDEETAEEWTRRIWREVNSGRAA